jgi:hypothetical protein
LCFDGGCGGYPIQNRCGHTVILSSAPSRQEHRHKGEKDAGNEIPRHI